MLGTICSCLAVAGALAAAPAAAGGGLLFASTGGSGVAAPDPHDGTTLVLQNADGIRSPSTFAVGAG